MSWMQRLAIAVGLGALLAIAFVPASSQAGIFGSANQDSNTSAESWPKLGLGARIGGHGFRHVRNERLSWNDCRMDGAGVFATLDVTKHFFGELSLDFYHATGKTVGSGMDRLSLYVLGAVGARFLPDFIVSPYIQAGIGPEWTKLEVGDHVSSTMLAAPFLGVGGEINLGALKLGGHIRSYAMGLPDHLRVEGEHSHGADGGMHLRYEAAGQAQFFARWEF